MREFATRLGVDHKSVSGWEAGKRLPDGSSLLALAEQFAADVNYILTGASGPSDLEGVRQTAVLAADRDGAYALEGGRARQAAPAPTLTPDEEILLDNYRHAPAGVRAGVKTTLETFAPGDGGSPKRGKAA